MNRSRRFQPFRAWPTLALAVALLAPLPAATGALGASVPNISPDTPSGDRSETASREPGVAGLLPLPDPELDRLDPPLVRQIEDLEGLIRRRAETAKETVDPSSSDLAGLADAFGALGHLYTYYEMPQPALTCYENAHRLQPGEPGWLYYLGFVEVDLGELERAAGHLEQVLRLAPDDLAARIRLGHLELDRDRTDAAEAHFRRALDIDPGLAAGWHGLGQVAARRGDDARAVEHFRKTLDLQPEADLVYYALGQALRRLGKIDEAREALARRGAHRVRFPDPRVDRLSDTSALSSLQLVRELAADREGFPDVRFLSYTMSQLASLGGAVERLEADLASWPEERRDADRIQRARLHYALGGLWTNRDQPDKARRHLRAALELLPDLSDARVKLANSLARDGQLDEAVAELTRVLEESPDDATARQARLKRAASHMALGHWQEADDDLIELERVDPNNFEVEGRLAVTLERLGRPEEAIARYQAAARLEPSTERAVGAHVQAATLMLRSGAADAALPELERAVELDPAHLDARVTLAGLLVRAQQPEQALGHFQGVLDHHPESVPAHLGRATVLLLLGRYRQARTALEKSLETLPGNAAVALLLARVLTAAPEDSVHDGARAEALARQLDEALSNPRSAELRALAAAETGRFDEALRWQRTAVERARQAGQERLASYLARRIPLYEAGRVWRARGPAELIVLPNEG